MKKINGLILLTINWLINHQFPQAYIKQIYAKIPSTHMHMTTDSINSHFPGNLGNDIN